MSKTQTTHLNLYKGHSEPQKYVSYLRVSTEKQGEQGLGVEAQRQAVSDFLGRENGTHLAEFVEVESGKRSDRPELAMALLECRRSRAILVVAKLDRLGRSVSFIARLMESGVEFRAVDNPHANKLTIHVLSAFAEHERDLISARTKAALAAARDRGAVLGNPDLEVARASALLTIKAAADAHAANVVPIIEQVRKSGVSTLRGIAAALEARGIPTPRGGGWHPSSVRNAVNRSRAGGE